MAKKKEIYKVKPLKENKKNIIAALIDEYDIETTDCGVFCFHHTDLLQSLTKNL